MIEIPESVVLANQINKEMSGKQVKSVEVGHSPHAFAWMNGNTYDYSAWLGGKTVGQAQNFGGWLDLPIGDFHLILGDGTNPRFFKKDEKRPKKHQLCLTFTDGSGFYCSVQMYGAIFAYPDGKIDNPYVQIAREKPNPLTDAFDRAYFDSLTKEIQPNLSAKAFLATEQRIPGLGNGVLQDILFLTGIHPKRKINSLTSGEWDKLYQTVKDTLKCMTDQGGRDVEKDLYGNPGGYQTLLSRKTVNYPCPNCGGGIVKTAYLGGSVYFCPRCQPLELPS